MNKYCESDVWIDSVCHFDDLEKLVAGKIFVLLVSIHYVDQGATGFQGSNIVGVRGRELLGTWEILYLELDVWVVVYG